MKTKVLFSAVCAATFLGSSAMADGDKMDLSSWDADTNKSVSQQEWADAIDEQGLFDRIDENNNGIFDIEEATEAGLDYDMAMDLDAGGNIDRHEFAVGWFGQHDANDDDMLDETEFGAFSSKAETSSLFMAESETETESETSED